MKTVKMEVAFTFDDKEVYSNDKERNDFFRGLVGDDLTLSKIKDGRNYLVGDVTPISVFLPSPEKNRKWQQYPLDL